MKLVRTFVALLVLATAAACGASHPTDSGTATAPDTPVLGGNAIGSGT